MSDDQSGSLKNIWYVSDSGSDDNDCLSTSVPCRNLQVVLNRATDGADIYVTSRTLPLEVWDCVINSSLSYTLRSYHNETIYVTCYSGMYVYLMVLVLVFADSAKPLYYSSHEFQ